MCLDDAWGDAVDPDALRAQLLRQDFSKAKQSRLAHTIGTKVLEMKDENA